MTQKHDRGRMLGVGFILLALAMVGQGLFVQSQRQAEQNCQADYSRDTSAVIAQRATWNDEDRNALNTMIFTVVDPTLTQKERRAAVQAYVDVQKDNDKKRKANPLPEYTCG